MLPKNAPQCKHHLKVEDQVHQVGAENVQLPPPPPPQPESNFVNFPTRDIRTRAPTPPPAHQHQPQQPSFPESDMPMSFQQFAHNGVEVLFENVHENSLEKGATAAAETKPKGQRKRRQRNKRRKKSREEVQSVMFSWKLLSWKFVQLT